MGDLVKGRFGANARRAKHRRSSLCGNGHHRWAVETGNRFDVKKGKLLTVERCERCGETRTTLR
ncbi:MAG: hypothetical protein WBN40_04985 [Pseudomonadales bacterium]